jgi:membrane associated rhomboid family serine protease
MITRFLIFASGTTIGVFSLSHLYSYEQRKKEKRLIAPLFTSLWQQPAPPSHSERFVELTKQALSSPINPIIGLNGVVFLAWQNPGWQQSMYRHFTHNLYSKPYTLLTSAFSHNSFFHIFFNMSALSSFAPLYARVLKNDPAHFAAFYSSAAVWSGVVSHLYNHYKVSRNPRYPTASSLGASGAIWAVLSGCATLFPNLSVNLLFIPVPFELGDAITGLILLDVVGLARGWRMFDHAAHLGGAAFGYVYTKFGIPLYNRVQYDLTRND